MYTCLVYKKKKHLYIFVVVKILKINVNYFLFFLLNDIIQKFWRIYKSIKKKKDTIKTMTLKGHKKDTYISVVEKQWPKKVKTTGKKTPWLWGYMSWWRLIVIIIEKKVKNTKQIAKYKTKINYKNNSLKM